nr:type II toxin-antitoxin system RelE/ParE family toxin [Neptunicella marina]
MALHDLKEIARFTQHEWGREQRNNYLKQFDTSFNLLAQNPELGKVCDDIRQNYRKFPQGSHVIFYKVTSEQHILIVRILHKSMDVNPGRLII